MPHRDRANPPRTSRARRALGQHFLTNTAAARRMVAQFAPAMFYQVTAYVGSIGILDYLKAGASEEDIEARLVTPR